MVLLFQRFRGQFRYGTLRPYAMRSLWRFAPYVLVLVAIVAGGVKISQWQQAERDGKTAAKIRASVGLRDKLSLKELGDLWSLANSSDAVRYSFLEQALEFPETAEQFNRRANIAVQSIVGLDTDTREKITKNKVPQCLRNPSTHINIKIACMWIGLMLSMEDKDQNFTVLAVKTLIEAIDQATDSQPLAPLVEALRARRGN